jgi:hypothetical protein
MILAAAVLGFAGAAQAGTMLQPVSASTTLDGWGWDINWTVSQNGLDQHYVSGVTDFDTFVSTVGHQGGWLAGYTASGSTNFNGFVDFDLGSEYTIESMAAWEGQGPAGANGEIASFNMFASNDPTFTTSTLLGSYVGTYAPFSTAAEVYSFAPTSARYVRLQVLSFYTGDISMGEFAFERSVVPAPAAAALLGMGGMMSLRRRR